MNDCCRKVEELQAENSELKLMVESLKGDIIADREAYQQIIRELQSRIKELEE